MAFRRTRPPEGSIYETRSWEIALRLLAPVFAQTSLARSEAGRLWSGLVRLHAFIRKRKWPWPTAAQLDRHCRGRFALSAQTIQQLIQRFLAQVQATRTKHQKGDDDARYPHRQPRYANVLWTGQDARLDDTRIRLPLGKGRNPLVLRLPPSEHPSGQLVRVELDRSRLILTFRATVPQPVVPDVPKTAAIDLGLCHLAALTDGEDTEIIVGRGLRSIKQRASKKLAAISSLQSHCTKGSRRWKKLQRGKWKVHRDTERRSKNLVHHASKQTITWAKERGVNDLVLGEGMADLTRDRGDVASAKSNQEMAKAEFARYRNQITYKGAKHGIGVREESEAYTSRTCPVCGQHNQPKGRRYTCKLCGYVGVRDVVGAFNFLNRLRHETILPGTLVPHGKVRYRRPVRLFVFRKERRARTASLGPGYGPGSREALSGRANAGQERVWSSTVNYE